MFSTPRYCEVCHSHGTHHTDKHQEQSQHDYDAAVAAYNNPPADWDQDDMRWAYEAVARARHRLYAANRFDVV